MKRKFERPTKHAGLEALRHSPGVCTCQKLRSVTRAATRLYDEHLRPAGLTISQYGILAALYYVPSLPLLKLAKRLETERTTLTRSVARLEPACASSSKPILCGWQPRKKSRRRWEQDN